MIAPPPEEFSLEFGSAMLMNLALRTAGKKKCAELDALTVALNLMEHWNPQIRTGLDLEHRMTHATFTPGF